MSEAGGQAGPQSPGTGGAADLVPPITGAPGGERAAEMEPPTTGDVAVDEALSMLTGLDELPVSEHHDRLAHVHEVLRAALDGRPGLEGGGPPDGGAGQDHPVGQGGGTGPDGGGRAAQDG